MGHQQLWPSHFPLKFNDWAPHFLTASAAYARKMHEFDGLTNTINAKYPTLAPNGLFIFVIIYLRPVSAECGFGMSKIEQQEVLYGGMTNARSMFKL
jgi:hypothetical protein